MIIYVNKKIVKKINFKNEKSKILDALFLFILIFGPPFMPYPHLVLSLVSLILLLLYIKKDKNGILQILKESGILEWIIVFSMVFLYTILIPFTLSSFANDIVNIGNYISIINRFGVLVVTILTCDILFFYIMRKKRTTWDYFIEVLIYAGMIEGGCSILAFLFPKVKIFFISLMSRFSGGDAYSNGWYTTVRCYGFASTLVDLFGLGIALIAGIAFFYGVTYKQKYIWYSMMIIIAALLNARTGVIVYLISIIITLVYWGYKGHIKIIIKSLIGIVLVILGACVAIDILSTNEATFSWVNSAYESVISIFKTKNISNNDWANPIANLINGQSLELPKGIRFIFGTGHSVYLAKGYKHSDIGYINEIWLWGILGCFIVYGFIIKISKRIICQCRIAVFKFAGLYLLISFAFFNFKCEVLGYNPGAVTFFLLFFGANIFNECRIEKLYSKGF